MIEKTERKHRKKERKQKGRNKEKKERKKYDNLSSCLDSLADFWSITTIQLLTLCRKTVENYGHTNHEFLNSKADSCSKK